MDTYDDLLALDNKLKNHQRHLQFLAIEIHKSKNKLYPSFMWVTYKEENIQYARRRATSLSTPNVNAQKNGINSSNFRGSDLWHKLPIKFRKLKFLERFKLLLKQSENVLCTCLACKAYGVLVVCSAIFEF